MKKTSRIIFLIIFFINVGEISFAKVKNNIILKVENEIITNYEIKNKIISTLILSNNEINQQNIDELKAKILEDLILSKLKKIELSKYDIKKNNEQINSYLNSVSSNDVKGLKEKFNKNNIDFKIFLEELEIQFKWQKLIYKIYSNKIEFNEDNINKDLEKLVSGKSNVEEFEISEIEILRNNDSSDNAKILEVEKTIKEQGFEKAAITYSLSLSSENKGYLGWVNGKSLSKEIYNILIKIAPGQITKPIKGQNNILFLKLNNERILKSENIDISELRKNLINQKKNTLFNLYSRSHLSKLKNTSLIEYK